LLLKTEKEIVINKNAIIAQICTTPKFLILSLYVLLIKKNKILWNT